MELGIIMAIFVMCRVADFQMLPNQTDYIVKILNEERKVLYNYAVPYLHDNPYPGVEKYTHYEMARLGMLPLVNVKPLIPKLGPVINDVTSFKYPITVSSCRGNPTSRSAFIAVISATENVLNREKIRKTWKNHVPVVVGKGLLSVARFFFVLGRSSDSLLQGKIRGESTLHRDILQLDILDFYRNLPFKMAGLLNWMNINCPKISFLLKVDDDVYVNVHNVAKMVESYHQTGKFSIFGRSQNYGFPPDRLNNFGPARDSNRYQITLEAWPWHTYPDYIIGPVYMIHGSSILPLLAAMQTTPVNPFEDVYVTGICSEKAGIKVLFSSGTTSLYAHSPFDDECEARKYLAWDDWLSPLSHEQIGNLYSGATNKSCDSPNASIKFNFRSNYSTYP